MHAKKYIFAGLAALLVTSAAQASQYHTYDTWDHNYTVQALLGAVQFENLKFDVEDGNTEIDVSLLPQLGAAWGTIPKGDRFQYGLECSFLLGFRFDNLNYLYLGGGGAYASISTSMWMFDLAGGPYASLFLDKNRKVRLYAGGGPLMVYADYRSDTQYPDSTPDVDNHESVFGIGLYARAGFEFRLYEQGMLGLGARGTWSNVDFSEVGGSSELTGIAAFISFTAGL
ncbi:MAG: hypothetical protein KAU94_01825 [Verrucomicrobia bacterium]|nr:hypothetical protein [Verrucomicrobiota bacterium]